MDEPGIFTVYAVNNGERFVVGTWFSRLDAEGMAESMATTKIKSADYAYVKQFGVGTIFHYRRTERLYRQDRLNQPSGETAP